MRPYRAFYVRATLFLLACLLAGCSALRLGYANGDTFLYWWMNGYIDFTDEQKPWVKARIDNLFAWHRKTQLASYAQLLAREQQRLQTRVTPADVQTDYAELKKQAMLVLDKALPDLTDLALSLQPQQIAHLEKKFASNNDSYRKDYLRGDVEDRQQFRFKKVMKQAEYWFGDFSAQQEAQIRAASNARPLDNDLWMAERLQRQQELIRILRKIQTEHPSREVVFGLLRGYIERSFEHFLYAEHKAFFDASRDGTVQMVALIVNIATPAQKTFAIKRAQKWIEDCRSLAAKAA
ncbi:DUF6279 family lipoprotein [Herbaspirillum sp. ST 5-3]|uniref:DUF6279 family lipoprotein n=1 Tax=Oxalobacteraceae TaxID=75682 RepID=UPI0010A58DAD|nr:DUF6279 family lipoprotein [Herbaspirillum sp. ST 5-3]